MPYQGYGTAGPGTAWEVGACERRCDGNRITELVKARDWLSGCEPGYRGPNVNPLKSAERNDAFPELPVFMSRDHLHDRNRETALFDPAQPGLETYVRVTRRRGPPEVEAQLAQMRQERVVADQARLDQHHSDTNELLALRSMLMQSAMVANKEANQKVAGGEWKGAPVNRGPTPQELRAQELHKKLNIDHVQLVTSPLQIDTTVGGGPMGQGHNMQASPPTVNQATVDNVTMRGGTWPVDDRYFAPPKPGESAKKGMNTGESVYHKDIRPKLKQAVRASS